MYSPAEMQPARARVRDSGTRLDQNSWRRWWRRLGARAVSGISGVLGSSPRLRGLALRSLLDAHMAPDVLCRVPFGDHTLYVDPRDDKIALKLLAGRPWQRRELETSIATLREAGRLRPDGLFIDVGANIGAQTVYAMRSGAFAGAVAIEPDPHNFEILERNLIVNGLTDRVQAIAAAASAASGRLRLVRHGKNQGAHSVEVAFVSKPAGELEVPAATLDEITQGLGISPDQVALVKIDVEGHELSVLKGMAELRRASVPILVELTANPADAARMDTVKSLLLKNYGQVLVVGTKQFSPFPLRALALQEFQSDLLVF